MNGITKKNIMKSIITSILSASVAVFSLTASVSNAEDEAAKSMTMEGTATCAKCDLGTAEKCKSVFQVKDGDKTVTYTLAGKAGGDWHKNICKGAKDVKLTGTVTEKDGEKNLDVTEIEIVEKPAKEE
jgi:RecG-like helicase